MSAVLADPALWGLRTMNSNSHLREAMLPGRRDRAKMGSREEERVNTGPNQTVKGKKKVVCTGEERRGGEGGKGCSQISRLWQAGPACLKKKVSTCPPGCNLGMWFDGRDSKGTFETVMVPN